MLTRRIYVPVCARVCNYINQLHTHNKDNKYIPFVVGYKKPKKCEAIFEIDTPRVEKNPFSFSHPSRQTSV